MRRESSETRQLIIDAAYILFYRGGFMRTSVDAVADAAGITKRTLYQHFTSKDELIEEVLQHQEQLALERIKQWADNISGNPEQMVGLIFDKLAEWAAGSEWQGSGFTRAAVEFADLPGHPARVAARRQKSRVESYLVEMFTGQDLTNPEQVVRQVMLLIEGSQSLALIHKNVDYIYSARQAAMVLIRTHRISKEE